MTLVSVSQHLGFVTIRKTVQTSQMNETAVSDILYILLFYYTRFLLCIYSPLFTRKLVAIIEKQKDKRLVAVCQLALKSRLTD